jgi:hypothetical protein
MTEQPEALRLADALDAGENFYAESSLWYDRKLSNAVGAAAAELRRLHSVNAELMDLMQRAVSRLEIEHRYGGSIMREWIIDAHAAIANMENKP